ncbi:hypothetical protein, partial [Corynebacterium glyciniphilum]|uniref:hypothetical protein n=1 Tax=Corynebacterium glyciniphilum TaxID=1404244 RepID=UPI0026539A22
GPHARVAAIVPAGDEGPDPLVQLGHRNDVGPMQGLAFDEPEPRLMSTTDEYWANAMLAHQPSSTTRPSSA